MFVRAAAASLVLLFAGCQAHKVVAQAAVETAAPTLPGADRAAPTSLSDEQAAERVRENFARILFDFDSASLDAEDQRLLVENVRILREHPALHVTIEGHADAWGSEEYNLALGDRRSAVVSKYLQDLGIQPTRLRIVSYGEERPLVQADSIPDSAPNRRAEFTVTVTAGG